MLNNCDCFIICDLCDMYFVYLFFKIMIKNFDFLWGFFFLNIFNEINCWNFCCYYLDEGYRVKKFLVYY